MDTLARKLKESRDEVKVVEKEKNVSNRKIAELCQTVKVLEKEVKEKVTTIKVKDNACKKFKKEKEELENRLNKPLQKPKTEHVTKFKCEFCTKVESN